MQTSASETTPSSSSHPLQEKQEKNQTSARPKDWAALVEAFGEVHAADAALLAHAQGVREEHGWRVRVPASVATSITPRLRRGFEAWLGEPVRWEEGEAEEAPVRLQEKAKKAAAQQAWEEARNHPTVQAAEEKLGAKLVEVIPPQEGKGGAS